jgi:hypothetical protein
MPRLIPEDRIRGPNPTIEELIISTNLTPEEIKRIEEIDFNNVNEEDYRLIEKYNANKIYINKLRLQDYNQALEKAKGEGPITYTPTEVFEETFTKSASDIAMPYLDEETGEIYDIFTGNKIEGADLKGNDYLFTNDGVIPLTDDAVTLISEFKERDYAFTDALQPTQYRGSEDSQPVLPRGATIGIPEGEDPSNYLAIGDYNYNGAQLRGQDSYGDGKVYVKVLDRPTDTRIERRETGQPVTIYPSMPEEPAMDALLPIKGLNDGQIDYSEDLSKTEYGSDYDSYSGEEPIVKNEETPATREPIDWGNVLKAFASSLTPVNMQGIQINIPNYRSPQYASPAIGPALQNYFRGK